MLIIGTVLLVAPVTAAFAWFESSARQATVGKRSRRLRVVDATDGSRIPFRRAVLRNTLKIALPWTIGHVAVFAIVGAGQSDRCSGVGLVAHILAYALPIGYVVTLWIGTGRTTL